MKCSKSTLLAILLVVLLPTIVFAQQTPVIIEAESGTVGAQFTTAASGAVTHITISPTGAGGAPGDAARVASYAVAFPVPGTWELYVRLNVGPAGANDDSFFYGTGLGAKDVTDVNQWTLANGLYGAGYTRSTDKVVGGGAAGTGVWKWVKLSATDLGEPPVAGFPVTAGNLAQTFQIGGREDGLRIDKLAFGLQGVYYTVYDLDNGLPGTTVPPPPPYIPPGPPIATGLEKFLGCAYSNSQKINFDKYWNQVTPENGGKWGSVEGTRDVMNWGEMDAAYALAKANHFPIKLHTLVWGSQQPSWIASLPPEEQLQEIEEWFAAASARYPDLDQIDVVNEPLHQVLPTYINALGGSGVTGYDWVLGAFRLARTYFPTAQLLINEYSITNSNTDTGRYIALINLLQAEHLIDGIGVQGHAFSTRAYSPDSDAMAKANLDRLAATGLPIYVTEMDIDGPTDEVQLADYQRIFPIFWEHPGVKGITFWGYRPGMWRTPQGAYLVYENGAERPAFVWLQEYVKSDNAPAVATGQSLRIDGGACNVVGTVAATDPDTTDHPGFAFLQDWKIVGGSGEGLFAIDPATGSISIVTPLAIDFARTSYDLMVSVSDGFLRSEPQAVTITIPDKMDVVHNGHAITVAKEAVPAHISEHGDCLGTKGLR